LITLLEAFLRKKFEWFKFLFLLKETPIKIRKLYKKVILNIRITKILTITGNEERLKIIPLSFEKNPLRKGNEAKFIRVSINQENCLSLLILKEE
jgi:hypothetical protein